MINVYIESYGCSSNIAEGEMLGGVLQEFEFKVVDKPEDAYVLIVNICTVKGDNVAIKHVQELKNKYSNKKFIVAGCVTPQVIKEVRKFLPDASFLSTHNVKNVVEVIEETINDNPIELLTYSKDEKINLPRIQNNESVTIVPILSGCNGECTYCSVRLIKGELTSYPMNSIVKEIRKAVIKGVKQIWITSQDNACYMLDKQEEIDEKKIENKSSNNTKQQDNIELQNDIKLKKSNSNCTELNYTELQKSNSNDAELQGYIEIHETELQKSNSNDIELQNDNVLHGDELQNDNVQQNENYAEQQKSKLPELLKKVLAVPGQFQVRLGMMNPNNVLPIMDELIEIYKSDKMFKFLHLPLQSGDDSILNRMGRKYSSKDFVNIINKFKQNVPEITIATDVIIGFPGETRANFSNTVDLVRNISPDILNISRFKSRQGTPAAKMKNHVFGPEIKNRSNLITEIFKNIGHIRNERWYDWQGSIVIEDNSKEGQAMGRNFAYKPVVVEGKFEIGQQLNIKVKRFNSFHLIGDVV